MPALKWEKDPNEILDFTHDWGPVLLEGDTVLPPPLALPDAASDVVVVTSVMKTATIQRVRLSGGSIGVHKLTLRMVAASGQSFDEGAVLKIKGR